MDSPLVELYRHNLWANLRLLDACDGLSEEQLDASVIGTYGRVRDTLVHLLAAEQRYVALLSGAEPQAPLRESDGYPGVAVLREHAARSGEALIQVAAHARAGTVVQRPILEDPHGSPPTRGRGPCCVVFGTGSRTRSRRRRC